MDIAKRFHQNPLLKPSDLQSGIEGMEITCFLNLRLPKAKPLKATSRATEYKSFMKILAFAKSYI